MKEGVPGSVILYLLCAERQQCILLFSKVRVMLPFESITAHPACIIIRSMPGSTRSWSHELHGVPSLGQESLLTSESFLSPALEDETLGGKKQAIQILREWVFALLLLLCF